MGHYGMYKRVEAWHGISEALGTLLLYQRDTKALSSGWKTLDYR